MTITKTNYNMKVNTSTTVYICESYESAKAVQDILNTHKTLIANGSEWYYATMTMKCETFCMVPKFFHNKGYWVTMMQHNQGDWDKEQTYECYLVEE